MRLDTVDVLVRVRVRVASGGASDRPGDLTTIGRDGLYHGPSLDEAVRAALADKVIRPKRLGFWSRLFYNRRVDRVENMPINNPQIMELIGWQLVE